MCMLSASASQALLQVLVGKPRSPGALMLLQEHGAGGCDVQHGDENMEVAKNTRAVELRQLASPTVPYHADFMHLYGAYMARSNAMVGACCCR